MAYFEDEKYLTEKFKLLSEKENVEKYSNSTFYHYSPDSFWDKLKDCAGKMGRKIFGRAVSLFYAIPNASKTERAVIIGALAYLITTIDFIPDFVPGAGFVDDAIALDTAIRTAAKTFTPQVIRKAEETVKEWFGE